MARKKSNGTCDICSKSFYSVKRHKIAVHDKLRPYSCKYCDKSFNDTSALGRHHAIHLAKGEKKFKCNICDLNFSTKFYLKVHKRSHDNKYFECHLCGSTFKGKYPFNEHVKSHQREIKCSQCEKVFNKTHDLNKHFHLIHTEQKERISCKECDSTFKAKGYLMKHMKYKHSLEDAGRWKCVTCSKIFSQQGALIVHNRIHTKEQFKCEFCGYTAVHKSAVKIHTRQIHIGEKTDLVCNICNKSFSWRTTMKDHQKIHTGEKPFTCICGHRFRNSGNLKYHARRKGCENDKEVSTVCDKRGNLFNCDLCAASFADERKFLDHKKLHTLIIDCDMCDMKTSNMGHMRMHRKNIHQLSV